MKNDNKDEENKINQIYSNLIAMIEVKNED